MNTKVVIAGLIVTMALVGVAVWGISGSQSPIAEVKAENNGRLRPIETQHDFGTISMAKGKVSKTFEIINEDTVAATVTKLQTSCMCTKATLVTAKSSEGPFGMPGHGVIPKIAAEIAPGETAKVMVEFDPAAHGPAGIGQIERVVTLDMNGQEPLTFKFRANVTP